MARPAIFFLLFAIALILSHPNHSSEAASWADCPTNVQQINRTYCESLCAIAGDLTTYYSTAENDGNGNLNRKQTCICGFYDASTQRCSKCDTCEVASVGWTKDAYAKTCPSLGINAGSTCAAYCDAIGSAAYEYTLSGCVCSGIAICGSGASSMFLRSTWVVAMVVGLAFVL